VGFLVILGDSISAGVGASHPLAGYAARLGPAKVIAKDGWTSRRLLKEARKQSERMWKAAENVLILIGGNDLVWNLPYFLSVKTRERALQKILREYEDNLRSLCALLAPLIRGKLILVSLYNPLPNSDFAKKAVLRMNEVIRKTAVQYKARFVDLFPRFEGRQSVLIDGYKRGVLSDMRLFGSNPIHPNDKGHQVIAEAILEEAINPLSSVSGIKARRNEYKKKTEGKHKRTASRKQRGVNLSGRKGKKRWAHGWGKS
jgi:acyl-CoA thioesterase I